MIDKLFVGVKKITSEGQIAVAQELAKENKHDFLSPTHVITRDDKVVGHASIAAIPFTHVCFSQHMQAEDSFLAIHQIESIVEERGGKYIVTPVGKDSPFHSTMTNPKMGYRLLANVDLFIKEL